jgi:hypothetical protein
MTSYVEASAKNRRSTRAARNGPGRLAESDGAFAGDPAAQIVLPGVNAERAKQRMPKQDQHDG